MQRKKIALVAGALATLVLIIVLFDAIPSQEMRSLRQTEQLLSLPAPTQRREVDDGENADWKGGRHYDRRIWLEYDNKDAIDSVLEKLQNSNWIEQPGESTQNPPQYYTFINKDQKVCVSLEVVADENEPYRLLLAAKDDSFCSFYFE